jgi:hypothetical protein
MIGTSGGLTGGDGLDDQKVTDKASLVEQQQKTGLICASQV